MWITMLKTYSGPAGVFAKGCRYDLPESTVEQLTAKQGCVDKKLYEESCAPWEDGVDQQALRAAEAQQQYELARAKADALSEQADAMDETASDLEKEADATLAEYEAVKDEFVQASHIPGDETADPEDVLRIGALERRVSRIEQLAHIARAKAVIADAEMRLKFMEAEDAEQEADRIAEELGIEAEEADGEDAGEPDGPADGPRPDVPDEVEQ